MNQNNNKSRGKVHVRTKSKRKAMTRYEKLNLRVNIIGHLLTFGLVLLTFVGLIIGIVQYNKNNEQQKKAVTISYLESLHELLNNTNDTLLEILKYYDIVNDTTGKMIYGDRLISSDSLNTILKDHHPYRKQLNDLYIGFNQFAIGCREGFFDEKTAWSANGSMINHVTKSLIPYYELIEKEYKLSYYGSFLRIMVFRWEHANPFKDEAEKRIDQFKEDVTNATKDSMPYIRRMPEQ